MSKSNLPITLTGEKTEYLRLYDLKNTLERDMTTSGSYSFTSKSSSTVYSTGSGGEYAVFLQLQTALENYNIGADDFNAKAEQSAVTAVANDLASHKADNTAHVPHLGITTNVGNNYSVTNTKTIGDGAKFSVKFNAAATNTATLNISSDGTARTLKKPDGSDFKPKAGIYSFIRDGVNFQLLGEGGEYGTATAAQVLAPNTIGTENGIVTGTMPNRGTFNLALGASVPAGYYSGGTVPSGKRFATGSGVFGTSSPFTLTVSGLDFTPRLLFVDFQLGGGYNGYYATTDLITRYAYSPNDREGVMFNPSASTVNLNTVSLVAGGFTLNDGFTGFNGQNARYVVVE